MTKPLELSYYLEERKDELNPLLILTHDYPDPDALASAFALQYLAYHVGIRSKIVYGGHIGRSENREMVRLLKIPAKKLRTSDFRHYPHIALVDTQPGFENNSFPPKRKASIVIDQHSTAHEVVADFILIDTEAGSTSALLGRELLAKGFEVPVKLATALVYGILSDTLEFSRTTKRETIDTYFELLPLADMRLLARIQNPSRPRRFFGEMVRGIQNALVRQRLIVSHLGVVENPDLVAQMADFLLTCEGIQWAFCTGRYGDTLHFSLRTHLTDVDAATILRSIVDNPRAAGGYGQVAGGKVRVRENKDPNAWEREEQTLVERLAKRLKLKHNSKFQPLVRSQYEIVERSENNG
ncbi:MAG: hypothetical protein N3A63_04135 [Bacteroidetes bacterium]|nr:hypothetical protein [Bacteroidota bacterium]